MTEGGREDSLKVQSIFSREHELKSVFCLS
jgi:hypothetical protein